MLCNEFLANGSLRAHRTSPQEIANLWQVVHRDLRDARSVSISADRRFAIAYNSALLLTKIVLAASGYRTASGGGNHWVALMAAQELLPQELSSVIPYFNQCRQLRNTVEYDRAGTISKRDAFELIVEAERFGREIYNWLQQNHPSLITASLPLSTEQDAELPEGRNDLGLHQP
ncbi:MAG: hypothetical protein NTV14_10080 [Coprothermobacterota bacterium]|nr:hypothetical protein [Coprothermobacterota bacterium]